MSNSTDANQKRILVIDDHTDYADSLSSLFQGRGHRSLTAYSGCAGLRIAEAFRPDVVFLDLAMPGMDGYAVAVAMRKIVGMKTVFIVALTGTGDQQTKSKVAKAGFDLYLTKPAQMDVIWCLVEGALSRNEEDSARDKGE